jgi:hypothetical protein
LSPGSYAVSTFTESRNALRFDLGSRLRRTSPSYNSKRRQTKCGVGEQFRSFEDAEYFPVDRRISGTAIQKEQIVWTISALGDDRVDQ